MTCVFARRDGAPAFPLELRAGGSFLRALWTAVERCEKVLREGLKQNPTTAARF